MTRGIRNNNPLNIRYNRMNDWQGKVPLSKKVDASFEEFTSMELGIRAAIKLMNNYIRRGFNTPKLIIRRWAPPSENATENYLMSVCRISGLRMTQELEVGSEDVLSLLYAMALVESGNGIREYREVFTKAWLRYSTA